MFICQYCCSERKNNNSLKNHELKCPSNPNRNYISYTLGKPGWNKGLTKETDIRVLNNSINVSKSIQQNGKKINQETEILRKEKLSISAKRQGFGGYRENAGISKKFKVIDSFGKETTLQSSYELLCKEVLEEMDIRWIRPKALKYNNRNYFADFYLVDYDIYLDPKNEYKAKQDEEKIRLVIEQNNVKVLILLKEHINKEYIAGII